MRFLFVDRILALASPKGSICGIKHITPDDYYLSSDDSGRVCFMSALIGETLGQMTAWAVMVHHQFRLRPVAGIVESVMVLRPAYLGETLELEAWIDELDDTAVQYHGEVRVGSELVFRLDGALGPLLPMDDFIDPLLVQRQFAEINRPGAWPYVPAATAAFAVTKHARPINLDDGNCSATLPMPMSHRLIAGSSRGPGSMDPAVKMRAVESGRAVAEYDLIIHSEPGIRMSAVKHVSRSAPYFPDHFPHKPVLPLTILLECHMTLAKQFLRDAGWHGQYQISGLRRIKMSDFVCPGDVVLCEVTVKSQSVQALILRFCATVDGKRMNVLEMVLTGTGGVE